MSDKTFLIPMNDDKKCCMSRYYESYHHCTWAEIYPTPKFQDQCKGRLDLWDDRPEWCPLIVVTSSNEIQTDTGILCKNVWVEI